MKNRFALLALVGLLAACSTPQYSYKFDYYNYQIGKEHRMKESARADVPLGPIRLAESNAVLSGSIANVPPDLVRYREPETSEENVETSKYKTMSKGERKTFRKEVKREIKAYAATIKDGGRGAHTAATKELDDELKLAIIFGAIGITLTVLGGINTIFWVLGVVGLVVGLIFFIRWIQTQ